ncbi:DegT/DnrJ/EryC1/StrS family aminotransferase [Negadavirga shengliensis]|uniref:DegT/DnrJ/EryC1/StrS family aminotransferase n=1 Tax=Negadavirga shengliensis TaxID=1389218 RepID=A0ABV9T858_9BACT
MKTNNNLNSRRRFIKTNALLGAAAALSWGTASDALGSVILKSQKPALMGGDPVRTAPWPKWPVWKSETDEKRILEVLRSGVWSRADVVAEFEEKWAETVGAKRCVTVVNGTNALVTALTQLDIGGGDEVLVPPYTFVASVTAILATGAMPVFVDTDRETFQIDPDKIEDKITPRTKAILPVHVCGLPADMTRIMKIAKKHNLLVVEDACQAWTAEIHHKQVGTFGDAGCYSFQNSKNIPIGEGGAVVSDNDEFIDRCFSYQNFGNPFGSVVGAVNSGTLMMGTKLRWTEYQAAIGLAQLERFAEQNEIRSKNAVYLRNRIKDIPGIRPYRLYDEVTKAAYHLFPFRFITEDFQGLSRDAFIKALRAEGIPCSNGYATLNTMPFLENTFKTKNFKKMYSKEDLDYKRYMENNQCPENDKLCNEEAVWFTQNMLLGSHTDMDDIIKAIEKIKNNAETIKNAEKS